MGACWFLRDFRQKNLYIPSSFCCEMGEGVEERVKNVLVEKFKEIGVEFKSITKEMHLVHDFGLDSLDMLEVIMALEDEFSINDGGVNYEELGIETVGDVIGYVKKYVAGYNHQNQGQQFLG